MAPMNAVDAIILGVVEGITEFLPVSSTGHLIITAALLGLNEPAETKQAVDAFNIIIQGGAIIAVLGLYWPRVLQMIRGLLGRDQNGMRLFINLSVAFMPAALIGLLLNDIIESYLFYPAPVMLALALGGMAMIWIGRWQRRHFSDDPSSASRPSHVMVDIENLTWRRALVIGLLQCVAMWPGTSRSMMTIVGGMLVGMKPRHAAEFSFLLGVPTLGGACLYRTYKSIAGDGPSMLDTLGLMPIALGMSVAAIAAAIAVKWLVAFLNHHGLAAFGWYRLLLCAVLGVLILRGVVNITPDQPEQSVRETATTP